LFFKSILIDLTMKGLIRDIKFFVFRNIFLKNVKKKNIVIQIVFKSAKQKEKNQILLIDIII
jgi:hypothetical protein